MIQTRQMSWQPESCRHDFAEKTASRAQTRMGIDVSHNIHYLDYVSISIILRATSHPILKSSIDAQDLLPCGSL